MDMKKKIYILIGVLLAAALALYFIFRGEDKLESEIIYETDYYYEVVAPKNNMHYAETDLMKKGIKFLCLEDSKKVVYAEPIDSFIGDDYVVGRFHVIDAMKDNEDTAFPAWIDERVDTILVGESDSIIYVFSSGGSSSITTLSRINLSEMKESMNQTVENAFQLEKMVDDGFVGTCFHRAQDIGLKDAGTYKTKFDFKGNVLYHEKIEE